MEALIAFRSSRPNGHDFFDFPGCVADANRLLMNKNYNHPPTNLNPEFKPNEGCGCVGSYNGGAGGGTAECSDCCKSYELGFKDKKRDPNCCCCEDTLQVPSCDKKPTTSHGSKHRNVCQPLSDSTCCRDPGDYAANVYHSPAKSQPAKIPCPCEDTYQGGLCHKKPASCCPGPDTYELVCNKDGQRYKGHGPDRGCYFSDDSCPTCQVQKSNNNNNCDSEKADDYGKRWARLRENHYASTCPEVCRAPVPDPCNPGSHVSKQKPKCSTQCCADEVCCTQRNYPAINPDDFKCPCSQK